MIRITAQSYLDDQMSHIMYESEDGRQTKTKLTQPEMDISMMLISKANMLITKEELYKIGWGERMVGPNSLNVAICHIRKAFKNDSNVELENIPKKGYMLKVIDDGYEVKHEANTSNERSNANTIDKKNDTNNEAESKSENQKNITGEPVSDNLRLKIKTDGYFSKPKSGSSVKKYISFVLLSLVNLHLIYYTFFIVSNSFKVNCHKDGSKHVCYSSSYSPKNDVIANLPSGLSVLSNTTYQHEEIFTEE